MSKYVMHKAMRLKPICIPFLPPTHHFHPCTSSTTTSDTAAQKADAGSSQISHPRLAGGGKELGTPT